MKDLYIAARHLYLEAFPDEDPAFLDALFAKCFPSQLVAMGDGGKLVSMLFALPYPIKTAEGTLDALYLYAVATAKEYRGKGYAKRLLSEVAGRGKPVFLRPLSPTLFDFYKSAGFTPFSPHKVVTGEVSELDRASTAGIQRLSSTAYLALRDARLPAPHCRMSEDFLSLAFLDGGAIGAYGRFIALFEQHGDTVLFKEWFGDPSDAPHAAAFLGASRYEVRYPDKNGTPFGVGVGIPEGTIFLSALD